MEKSLIILAIGALAVLCKYVYDMRRKLIRKTFEADKIEADAALQRARDAYLKYKDMVNKSQEEVDGALDNYRNADSDTDTNPGDS